MGMFLINLDLYISFYINFYLISCPAFVRIFEIQFDYRFAIGRCCVLSIGIQAGRGGSLGFGCSKGPLQHCDVW